MAFNGHYAVPPTGYYTQPPNAPSFNAATFHHGFPPPMLPSTNLQRFEANSQVPPIPFWNPEILKQLSQFPGPLPPPPPIPNGQLGTPPFIVQQTTTPQPLHQSKNGNRLKELREEAKQAIADLSSYLKYQDFLDEGVSRSVLDMLYTELGIDKNQHIVDAASEPASHSVPEPAAEPVVDAGLERKDRIARLLAAKKGRNATGANSPAQASTPELPTTVSGNALTSAHEIVSTPTPDIPVPVHDESTPAAQEPSLTSVSNVPTPISPRAAPQTTTETSMRAFSIPGLSMTADDQAEQGIMQSRPKVNTDKLNARMAALKADMQRKKALQDGMPVLDAEVEKTRERLTEQRNKLATIRQNVLTTESQLLALREDESRLLEEINRLEKQLAEGENGQKQFSNELTQLNDQITAQEEETASHASMTPLISPLATIQQPPTAVLGPIVDDGTSAGEMRRVKMTETHDPLLVNGDTVMEESTTFDAVPAEAHLATETQSTHVTTTATPSDVAPALESDEDDEDRMSIDGASDTGSGGSASMSDSGSEYEPAVDQFIAPAVTTEDHDDYEPQESVLPMDQAPLEVDNDDYEPSEKVDAINVDALDITPADGDVLAPIRPAPEEEQGSEPSALPTPAEEAPVASAFPTRYSSSDRVVSATQANDDLLTHQQPLPAPIKLYEDIPPLDNKLVADRSYIPYKSPLTILKSFRFHPQFTQLIPNGYRSLTYSNQVDANRPLCSTELEGKMCTDVKCEDQHFAALGLSGACPPEIANLVC